MGASLQPRQNGRRRRRGTAPPPEINVTPLVDVMLVLLIIFMVSAPMLNVGVQVNLPQSGAKPLPYDPDIPLSVTVQSDGRIFVQQAEVPGDELVPKLQAIIENRQNDRIYVRADADVPYGIVAQVMGRLSGAGFSRVGLVTKPDNG